MSLTASEQRALARIEHALRSRDPLLESLFATFTSLTWREALPAREQVQRRGWRPRMIALVPLAFVLIAAIIARARSAPADYPAAPRPSGWLTVFPAQAAGAPLRHRLPSSLAPQSRRRRAPPTRSQAAQDDHGTAGDRERRRAVHGPALPARGGGRVGVEDQLP